VNALANDEVGTYLNQHFVSSYQKVGTFKVVNGQKQGGNVASYFCTPDGRVLDAIAGPVDAATLLREARWVMEIYKLALLDGRGDDARLRDFWKKAHADRLRQEYGVDVGALGDGGSGPALSKQGRVHLLLAAVPLVRLDQTYRLVFERILGETVSTAPVQVVGAARTRGKR
jgi:hypothetical protein